MADNDGTTPSLDAADRRGSWDVAAMREAMASQAGALPSPASSTTDHSAEGIPVRFYAADGSADAAGGLLPLLVFLHGGGWILGDLDTHDACCRWLATSSGCAVLAVDYRLAPEHPFPAGLDDCRTAFRWAQANAVALGCDPDRIAIGGESAGANLAAAATLALRDAGEPMPLFQFLVHPPTDLLLERPSIDDVDLPGLTRELLEFCIESYVGRVGADRHLVSPLRAPDLSGLGRTIVVTVENDPLRDDGEAYALALAQAGNEVCLQRLPGLPHGFMFLSTEAPEVMAAFRLLGTLVARYFSIP